MPADPSPKTPSPTTPCLDPQTRELIREKARQIVSRSGFSSADVDDIEHDIAIQVLRRLPKFDPAKADGARFVRLLLAHAVSTVLRDRRRQKRRVPVPLDAVVRKVGQRAGEPVDAESGAAIEELTLTLDVAEVLATLPRKLRRVAETLKTHSVTAAARRLKLSRTAVYRRLAELREAFAAAGLEEFPLGARTPGARTG
jgi:RNA polymerase sigma-70 factor (ECF subfamily)